MKIVLAVDSSEYSRRVIQEFTRRPWPTGTEVRILSVCVPFPYIPFLDPILVGPAERYDFLLRERASRDADEFAKLVREKVTNVEVAVEVLEGFPKKMIVEEAERWGADLIILGSHGEGPLTRFLLGSVAQSVVLHAPCSVEVVRRPQNS